MSERISRRKLANYVVEAIEHGSGADEAIAELAAYLIETKRTREAELVVRSIEDTLAEHGTVIAHVSSAHPLDENVHETIQRLLNASTLHLTKEVDPSLIGGIRVEAPGKRLDATVKRNILALSQVKL